MGASHDLEERYKHYSSEEMHYILYESISIVYPFVKFEQQIADINDYCCLVINSLEAQIKKDKPSSLDNKKIDYSDQLGFLDDDLLNANHISFWEAILRDINKCTMLLLLLSYLESSLNEIANWFCKEKRIPFKNNNTNVTYSLDKIGQCCGVDLNQALKEELKTYNKVRKIRNEFVHKEWDQLTDRYDRFELSEVFNMVSLIIAKIEKKACEAHIIEEDPIFSKRGLGNLNIKKDVI